MNLKDIKDLIITPALKTIALWDENIDVLMLCTGMQETGYSCLKQHPGPALGPWQVEPETHSSIKAWLNYPVNKLLKERIISACYMACLPPADDVLVWNWRYSLIIGRLVYHRATPPVPPYSDIEALSNYYCKYYNAGGKAEHGKVCDVFKAVVDKLHS